MSSNSESDEGQNSIIASFIEQEFARLRLRQQELVQDTIPLMELIDIMHHERYSDFLSEERFYNPEGVVQNEEILFSGCAYDVILNTEPCRVFMGSSVPAGDSAMFVLLVSPTSPDSSMGESYYILHEPDYIFAADQTNMRVLLTSKKEEDIHTDSDSLVAFIEAFDAYSVLAIKALGAE